MPTRPRRILFIENDPDVLTTVTLVLRLEGYEVLQATTVLAARQAISEAIFHAAIIDIRIDDDRSENDSTGFELARLLPPYIPFIIHTAHDTRENIRQAFGAIGAEDVINKDAPDAPQQLLNRLQVLFLEKVGVNFDLQIQPALPLTNIVAGLDWSEVSGVARPTADDLEILLCRLFQDASAIYPTLLTSPETAATLSQRGAVLLRVQEKRRYGTPMSVVVKLGSKVKIDAEAINYQMIRPYLGGNRLARLENQAYSRHLGGLVYTLVGADDWEPIQPLSQRLYMLLGQGEADQVTELLDRFFRQTYGNLYKDAQSASLYLTQHYTECLHLTVANLKAALLEFYPSALENSPLRFNGLLGEYFNPIAWVVHQGDFRKFASLTTRVSLCHGDLHSRNIFTDDKDEFWLVDFAHSSVSHALRDIVELETDLKFFIAPEIDIKIRLMFEQQLLIATHWRDSLPTVFPEPRLAAVYSVIINLRRLAYELIEPFGDMQEYYQALLWTTLNVLRFKNISSECKQAALLSASLIAQRLNSWPQWHNNTGSSDHDLEKRSIWKGTVKRLQTVQSFLLRLPNSEIINLIGGFFQLAGYNVRAEGWQEFFTISKETSDKEKGRAEYVYCLQRKRDVEVGDIERLNQILVDQSTTTYCYLIFQNDLQVDAIHRIWHLKKKNNLLVIPIHELELRQILSSKENLLREVAAEKLALVKNEWSSTVDPYESIDSLAHPQWFFAEKRKQEAREILEALRGGVNWYSVHGMRRVGKSALINQLVREASAVKIPTAKVICRPFSREYSYTHLLSEIRIAWLQAIAFLFPDQKLSDEEMSIRYTPATAMNFAKDSLALAKRVFHESNSASRLTLVIDEMDHIFPKQESTDDAYEQFCALGQILKAVIESPSRAGLISIVVVTEHTRINTTDTFPGRENQYQNPFYGRFRSSKCLEFLSKGDWEVMIQKIGALAGLTYTVESLGKLFDKSAGHPQISRKLCSCLVEMHDRGEANSHIAINSVQAALKQFLENPHDQAYYLDITFWRNKFSPDLLNDRRIMQALALEDKASLPDLKRLGNFSTEKEEVKLKEGLLRLIELHIVQKDTNSAFYSLTIPIFRDWIRKNVLELEVSYE